MRVRQLAERRANAGRAPTTPCAATRGRGLYRHRRIPSLRPYRRARGLPVRRRITTLFCVNQTPAPPGVFESRLWQELRQKRGLVYSADSSLIAERDRGNFQIELSASPDHVVSAVDFVRRELRLLQTEPVSQTELQEAKLRLAGDALLSEASADGQAQQLLDIGKYDLPLSYYRNRNEELAHVTAADVERVAQTYLEPDKLIVIYAGPSGPWAVDSL